MADGEKPAGGSRLEDLVTGCALACPSGVLYPSVRSSTALYLADGLLSYAEPGTAPGLGVRLVAGGRLDWQRWTQLRATAMAHSDLPALLLSEGVVRPAELAAMLRSTIVDALFELLTSPETEPWQPRTVPSPTSWTGSLVRLPVDAAVEAAVRVARTAARRGISADDVLVPLDPAGDVVVTDAMWRLRWELDGRQTSRRLAWRTGTSLVETLEAQAALLDAGLCTTVATPAAAPAPSPERAPDAEPAPAPEPARAPTPEPAAAAPPAPARLPRRASVSVAGAGGDPPDAADGTPAALPRRPSVPRPWDVPSGAVGLGTDLPTPFTDATVIERILRALKEKG